MGNDHKQTSTHPEPLALTDEVVDAVAVEAEAADISVLKVLVGLPVRGRVAARIRRALDRRGVTVTVAVTARTASSNRSNAA